MKEITKGGADKKKDQVNKRVQSNIMIMLKCLFPTKYPYFSNIKTSYDIKIRKFPQLTFDVTGNAMKMFRLYNNEKDDSNMYSEYSYLKLEGKVYTVSEVVWLNDIYNHPEYKKVVNAFDDLIFFKKTYTKIIENLLSTKKEILKSKISSDFTDITSITDELKSILKSVKEKDDAHGNVRYKSQSQSESQVIINQLIQQIEKFNLNSQKIDSKDAIIQLNDTVKLLIRYIEDYKIKTNRDSYRYNPLFTLSEKLNDFFEKIKIIGETISDVRENNYIYSNYLLIDKIDRKILTDSNISSSTKDKFKRYINFFEILKQFDRNKYVTNNGYLMDLFNNTWDNHFLQLLNPRNISLTPPPFSTYLDSVYSGVNTILPEDMNEIFIQIDLIEGEVTDENKKNIKCVYKGEKLTDKLDTLLSVNRKFWEVNPRRMLFSVLSVVSCAPIS
jgi:hypothetical protein